MSGKLERRTPPGAQLDPRNWVGKVAAALILGFTLALGLSGLLAWFGPGGIQAYAVDQAAMWSIAVFWCPILALCFLFRNGLRAWLWLGAANIFCYGLLFVGRALIA